MVFVGAFEQAAPEPSITHKLDIVIAHYYEKNLNDTLKLWSNFLNEDRVRHTASVWQCFLMLAMLPAACAQVGRPLVKTLNN